MNYHNFVNNDYKMIDGRGDGRRRHRLPLVAAVVATALGLSAFSYLGDAANVPPGARAGDAGPAPAAKPPPAAAKVASAPAPGVPAAAEPPEPAARPISPAADGPPAPPALTELATTVRPGDSLARIFRRLDVPAAELMAVIRAPAAKARLARLQPGQGITLRLDDERRLHSLVWARQGAPFVVAERAADGFILTERDSPPATPAAPAPVAASPVTASPAPAATTAGTRTLRAQVRSGDSLALIFKRLGIAPAELAALVRNDTAGRRLSRIRPGQEVILHLGAGDSLQRLDWRQDRVRTLVAERQGDAFAVRVDEIPLSTELVAATGTIESSLFEAGQRAGLSDRIIMGMAEILGWDIDFAQDLREGDRFSVIYEEHQDEAGEMVEEGDVLAVEFANRGRVVKALHYEKPDGGAGYYSPDGHSMRKAFRRMPVRFGRVSSGFTRARWHPVLHRFRAHKGVDYAAPRGTPILATGDGKVTFRGTKGGYGKTIVIKHGERYTTLYAHMSRFQKGVGTGSRVTQGQVVGYVGSSGLATGPHVHYEFRVAGVHRDPLKVELPKALPLERRYLADFRAKSEPLLARLDQARRTQLALNEN